MVNRSYLDAQPTKDYGTGIDALLGTTDAFNQPFKLSQLERFPNAAGVLIDAKGRDLQVVNDRPNQPVNDQISRIMTNVQNARQRQARQVDPVSATLRPGWTPGQQEGSTGGGLGLALLVLGGLALAGGQS